MIEVKREKGKGKILPSAEIAGLTVVDSREFKVYYLAVPGRVQGVISDGGFPLSINSKPVNTLEILYRRHGRNHDCISLCVIVNPAITRAIYNKEKVQSLSLEDCEVVLITPDNQNYIDRVREIIRKNI